MRNQISSDEATLREQLARTQAELRLARDRIAVLESVVRTMRLLFRAWLSLQPDGRMTIPDGHVCDANLGDQIWWHWSQIDRATEFRLLPHATAPVPGADPFIAAAAWPLRTIDGPTIEISR